MSIETPTSDAQAAAQPAAVDLPRRATAPLRSSTLVFGHRDSAAGPEPWVGRLSHDGDLAFGMLSIASGIIAEQTERERSALPGAPLTLDAEALAERIVREGEGVFAFDTVFPHGGQPAVFHTTPTIHHFASPSHEPLVRLNVVDCDRLAVHVFGGGSRLHIGSSALQLCFGPTAPNGGLDPRLEREAFVQVQDATDALLAADWTLNERSRTLAPILRDARQIALPTFEWHTAIALAERRNLKLCFANLAELGTIMKGTVIYRGDFYMLQQDRESKRIWAHDRTELDGRVPEIGDELVVIYEQAMGVSLRANPVRGHARLVGPAPEVREPIPNASPAARPPRSPGEPSLGMR